MNIVLFNALKAHGIDIFASADAIQLGFGGRRLPMEIEAPVQLRRGQYDIEQIGAFSYLGGGAQSIFRHIKTVGRFCSIAGNVITGSMEHPTNFLSTHPLFYGNWSPTWPEISDFYIESAQGYRTAITAYSNRVLSKKTKIEIGNDVWIGDSAFISRGVKIGDGVIIAARSVVTKDVPPYAIVGGVPAKVIRYRFDDAIIDRLERLRWWDYGLSAVAGADFSDIHKAMDSIEERLSQGLAEKYEGRKIIVHPDDTVETLVTVVKK